MDCSGGEDETQKIAAINPNNLTPARADVTKAACRFGIYCLPHPERFCGRKTFGRLFELMASELTAAVRATRNRPPRRHREL